MTVARLSPVPRGRLRRVAQVTTRWRDDDAYGHLNNATYYELFDTAVNAHLYDATGLDIRALPAIGIVAETSCRYFRAIGFPAPIDTGLVVERLGTSSVVYRIGLFQGADDEAAAEGRFVHVYVDNTRRRGRGARPAEIRAAVSRCCERPDRPFGVRITSSCPGA